MHLSTFYNVFHCVAKCCETITTLWRKFRSVAKLVAKIYGLWRNLIFAAHTPIPHQWKQTLGMEGCPSTPTATSSDANNMYKYTMQGGGVEGGVVQDRSEAGMYGTWRMRTLGGKVSDAG